MSFAVAKKDKKKNGAKKSYNIKIFKIYKIPKISYCLKKFKK